MTSWAEFIAMVFGFYFLAALVVQGMQLIVSVVAVRRDVDQRAAGLVDDLSRAGVLPPLSILLPAFNEEADIIGSVESLLECGYPTFEVVVVNDGSTDATLDVLTRHFDLRAVERMPRDGIETQPVRGISRSRSHPEVFVVDKENGGKSDALNAALNLARYPLFCSVDADSVLEPGALAKVAEPMVRNPSTVAAGGIVRVVNGSTVRGGRVVDARAPHRILAGVQVVEYLRAFLLGRAAWSQRGALLIVSGAFAMFRRAPVVESGGYSTDTVGEDAELVTRLHHLAADRGEQAHIVFVADPVCWTEVPDDLPSLRRQRIRWQQGLIQTLWAHRGILGRRRGGAAGTIGMPYFWLVEVLGPVIEIIAAPLVLVLLLTGQITLSLFLIVLLLAFIIGGFFSIAALLVDQLIYRTYRHPEDVLRLVRDAILESVVLHQLLAVWRLEGTLRAFRHRRGWAPPARGGTVAGRLGEPGREPA